MVRTRNTARSAVLAAGSVVALSAMIAWTTDAQAIVVHGSPLAKPANSYVGSWNGSTAIAIGPKAVITAKHVMGLVTQRFTMNNVQYTVKAIHPHPSADLQVIELNNSLPGWHQIATSAFPGQPVLVAGMGFIAGTPASNGYNWSGNRAETWGKNAVDTVTSWYLVTRFDSAGGSGEAMFATYDSGGGVFFQQPDGSLAVGGIAVSISSSTGFSAFGDRGYAVNLVSQQSWLSQFTQLPPCPGDLNGDRAINSGDFTILLNAFGKPNGGGADLDGDGDCDFADFNVLVSRFGINCS